MGTTVRELDAESDLDRVADFFNRNGYGPAGVTLSGSTLGRIFRERAVGLFLLAEERGRVVGTVGYARTSGRRVAPEGQLFAGMFVIAPSHRSGLLAGKLFADSFERLVQRGVRGLRVEVNPANARAFPLYVRVGFRALDGMFPDEEGYVELVSALPGVSADLVKNALEWTGHPVDDQRRNWRSIHGARRQTVESGVGRLADGTRTIQYDFELPGRRISATAVADDASIIALSINGELVREFGSERRGERLGVLESLPTAQVGEFAVSVDACGTITVRHARHLGIVLSDPHPVVEETAEGARRPIARRVDIRAEDGCWTVTDGEVVRVVEFLESGLRMTVQGALDKPMIGIPWVGLRSATLSLFVPGGDGVDGPRSARHLATRPT